ncbi:hypothetical protein Hanom_Chr01g00048791 [Helianthus anomalus]
MSDKWPKESKEVPFLLFNGVEVALYQAAFQTFGGTMGVRPLRDHEESWYERIKCNLMFAPPESFANPPEATEGARIPNPRPLHGVTSAGKETVYLSSEEFVASSNQELSTWDDVFVGVMRDLRIDPGQKIPKKTTATSKKTRTTLAASNAASKKGTLRFHQSNLEDYVIASESLEGLHDVGEKPQSSAAEVARSSGSTGSRGPDSGTTPSSAHDEEETEAEVEAEKLIRKRPSTETAAPTPPAKKAAPSGPIGKNGGLRSLYRFSPGEKVVKIIPEKVQGPEVVKITGLDQPVIKRKEPQVHITLKDVGTTGAGIGGSGAAAKKGYTGKNPRRSSTIHAEDTSGDIYYNTYTEDRANEAHVPVWTLKQKDTFDDFGACRDWLLGTFPPGEVNRQRARNHENLYHSYVMGHANSSTAGHQILRERQTMHQERAIWEKYCERLSAEAKVFEQAQIKLQEDKAAFDKEKKSQEWGLQGLKTNFRLVRSFLLKSVRSGTWPVIMRTRKYFKGKYEEANSQRERVEIDLGAEKVNADTAEEARKATEEAHKISTSTLNVAQKNYTKAQSIVDTLLVDSEWMRNRGVAYFANSILNGIGLDRVVVGLTDAARAVGHPAGNLECTQYLETTLK